MNEQPPPYFPLHPSGATAPSFPSAFSSQPASFPSSPYQAFPQTYGGQSYYQGSQGPTGSQGTYPSLSGYQGYPSGSGGASSPWDGKKTYGETPKQSTVFLVDQNRGAGRGAEKSCLAACSAALCCCCLWDMLTRGLR
ncbi:cysteine-rich and transmembrane domain-containing protein 1-like [Brachionichthys hirsutus]|uniref:cysteine-rich and transmembrane domain-containing protein 1-like n=1 Tax=Brachionichthys hirsutus TaxID=412623 RepID=UPI003604F598